MKHLHSSLFTLLCPLLLLLLLLTACREEESDYRLAVPADALAICEVNVGELATQASLSLPSLKFSLAALAADMGGGELKQWVEGLVADPTLTGIDFTEPAYFFLTAGERIGLVMKVNDENLLSDLLAHLETERICRPVEQEDGYRHTRLMDLVDVAYDGHTILLTTSLSLTVSSARTATFIARRMAGEEAYFGETETETETDAASKPLLCSLSADDNGAYILSAPQVEGPALLAQLKRMPRAKSALRMAEVVVDAEAILRAVSGPISLTIGNGQWQFEARLGNTDFLDDIDEWATAANDYGCAINTLGTNHYELCTPALRLLMSVEDDVLKVKSYTLVDSY